MGELRCSIQAAKIENHYEIEADRELNDDGYSLLGGRGSYDLKMVVYMDVEIEAILKVNFEFMLASSSLYSHSSATVSSSSSAF